MRSGREIRARSRSSQREKKIQPVVSLKTRSQTRIRERRWLRRIRVVGRVRAIRVILMGRSALAGVAPVHRLQSRIRMTWLIWLLEINQPTCLRQGQLGQVLLMKLSVGQVFL